MVRFFLTTALFLSSMGAFSTGLLTPGTASAQETSTSSSGVRLAMQARMDAINLVLVNDRVGVLAPFVTPGIRLVDQKLFVGLGFGFFGVEGGSGGVSFSPMVNFDILRNSDAALHVAAWFNIANFAQAPDLFAFGLTAVAGVRALISSAFSVGAELGWGFISTDGPGDDDVQLSHGVVGNLVVEASIGL